MTTPLTCKPFPSDSRHSNTGFSLIEILVVAGILAVLAALAFPTLGNLRDRGDAAKCTNNLRQIASAGIRYVQDNGGLLPDMGKYCSTSRNDPLSLLPYLDFPMTGQKYIQATVFTCPTSWRAHPTDTDMHRTYAINRYATSSRVNQPEDFAKIENSVPKRLQNVERPSQMAFFMDGMPRGDNRASTYYVDQNYARLHPDKTPFLHGHAINAVFLDGHVERISREHAEETLSLRTSTKLPFWGSSN